MPANFQKFLPLLLIVFLLLFVLPTIFKHHSSKGLSSKELSQETIATTTKVDALQREFRTAHKGYTGSVADLLALDHSLGKVLGDGVVIALDVSTDKQTYYAQVASSVIQLDARPGGRQGDLEELPRREVVLRRRLPAAAGEEDHEHDDEHRDDDDQLGVTLESACSVSPRSAGSS